MYNMNEISIEKSMENSKERSCQLWRMQLLLIEKSKYMNILNALKIMKKDIGRVH